MGETGWSSPLESRLSDVFSVGGVYCQLSEESAEVGRFRPFDGSEVTFERATTLAGEYEDAE